MEPEQVATIDDEIAKPDPNPDMLPAIPVGFALQEQKLDQKRLSSGHPRASPP